MAEVLSGDPDTQTLSRKLTVAYLGAFVVTGLGLGTAGPALSHLRQQAHTDEAGFGLAFVGLSAGYILTSMYSGRGVDKGGGHRRWTAALTAACVATLLISVAPNLLAMVLAFSLLGGAAGACDVNGNTLMAWSKPKGAGKLLSAGHLCFAIGAMVTPIIVNRSLHWFDSIWGVAVPMALITALCGSVLLRQAAPVQTRSKTGEKSGERGLRLVLICGFLLAYVAMETGFTGWIHTYVEDIHYGNAATATGVATMFGAGFVFGRALSVFLNSRFSAGKVVAGATISAVVAGLLFTLFSGPGIMLWAVTFLFAVSVAPQYAAMLAFAETHLALSGKNAASMIAAAGVGNLVMPWAIGQLFHRIGPGVLPPTMLILASVTAVFGGGVSWVVRSKVT